MPLLNYKSQSQMIDLLTQNEQSRYRFSDEGGRRVIRVITLWTYSLIITICVWWCLRLTLECTHFFRLIAKSISNDSTPLIYEVEWPSSVTNIPTKYETDFSKWSTFVCCGVINKYFRALCRTNLYGDNN